MKLAILILAALGMCGLALVCLTGCAAMDGYDRSYSLSYGDGKQVIQAGVTLHPRTRTGGLAK